MTKIFKRNIIVIAAVTLILTLLIGMFGLFLPVMASNGENNNKHVHCVCGGDIESGEHTLCDNVTFAEYTGGDVTYNDEGIAYLYLASDVVNSSKSNNRVDSDGIFAINKGQTLYLCLNGHSMQNSDRTSNVIDVNEGGNLILCDCQETGWIGGRTSGANSGAVWVKGNFTLYGGSLKNNQGLKNGGGLYLAGSGNATMYGGSICDNFTFNDGGGVYLKDSSTFTMYSGFIENNRATDEGGGVFVNSKTTFNMHGGIIKNNQSGVSGGGVFVYDGTFTMNSGFIESNTSGRGGGIGGENSAVLTINDGTLKDNIAYGNGGGISLCNKSTLTVNGSVIKNNKCNLNGGGIFLFGNGGYNNATSTFNITGGTIKNNKALGSGGGIYFYEYTNFNVNGEKAIKIIDNEGGNLYLTDNKNYVLTLTAIVEGSSIGVTAMRFPWNISNANDTDYSGFFSADSDDCIIGYNSNDKKLFITDEFYKATITYNLNGGHGDITDGIGKSFIENEYSVSITAEVPTKVCYNFVGWADSADATSADYNAGDKIEFSKDKTLYAVWSASHVITKVNKIAPDCTNCGKEEYYTCECGKCYLDEYGKTEIADINSWGILPAAHTFTAWIDETAATEETDGVKAHKDCTVCHKHFDDYGNEICDAELQIDKIIVSNADDKGLSGGAVAGISIAGTIAVETCGFAIIWFVIKKKKWADFIALFVKK